MASIAPAQLFLSVLATVVLSMAATGAVLRLRYRAEGVGRVVPTLTAVFLLLDGAVLLWRALNAADARQILANRFDVTLLFAAMVTVVGLHSQLRRSLRGLDTFMLPVALLIQLGAFWDIAPARRMGVFHVWFVVHQVSFVVGATLLVCGGVAGGAYLVLNRVLRRKQSSSLLWRLAPLESWERSGRWSLLLGFLCITFGVLTGICQAAQLSGASHREWLTDGFIIAAFVVWGLYGLAVTATWVVPRFRGRRSAQLAVVTGVLLMVVFLVAEKLSGVHR